MEKFTIKIVPLEEGGYFAQAVEYPAVITEAETEEELYENILDALNLHLSSLQRREGKDPQPAQYTRESLIFA